METVYKEFKLFQSSMVKAHSKSILTDKLTLPKPIKHQDVYLFPCKVHMVGGFEHIVSGIPMNVNLDGIDFKAKGGLEESERLFKLAELQQAYDRAFSYGRTPESSKEPLFRYSVEGIIGCGAFGCTLMATDNLSEPPRKVAIKVVMNPEHSYMGIREAISLKWFQRKVNGVVSSGTKKTMLLLSTFYQQERFCLVFELLENLPIHAYSLKPPKPYCGNLIDDWQPIGKSPDQAKRLKYLSKVTFQIVAGVSHLHSQGVIHSDLKPDNILRDPTCPSNIKIADFGNCIIFDQLKKYKGVFEVQTESHRAPELLAGLPFGRSADMWSIGIILCQAILGKNPFHVLGSTSKTLAKIVEILGGLPENPYSKAAQCNLDLIASDSDALKKGLKTDRKKPVYGFSTAVRTMRLAAILGLDKSEPVVNFITELLHLDPSRRLTCLKAFTHPFLSDLVGLDLKALLNNVASLDDSGVPVPKARKTLTKPVYSTPPRTLSTLKSTSSSSLSDTKPGYEYDRLQSVNTLSPGSDIFSRATSKSSVHSVATTISRTSSLSHKLGKFSIKTSSLSNTEPGNHIPDSSISQPENKEIYSKLAPASQNIILDKTPFITNKSIDQSLISDKTEAKTSTEINSLEDASKISDFRPCQSLPDPEPEINDPQLSFSFNDLNSSIKNISEKNISRTSKILANLDSVSDLSFGLLDIEDKSGMLPTLIRTPVKRKFQDMVSNEPNHQDKKNNFNILDPSPKPQRVIKNKFCLTPLSSTVPSSSSSGEFILTHIRRQTTLPSTPSIVPETQIYQNASMVHPPLKETISKPVVFGNVYSCQKKSRLLKDPYNIQRISLPQTILNRPAFTYSGPNSSRAMPQKIDYCCNDDIILVPSKSTSDK